MVLQKHNAPSRARFATGLAAGTSTGDWSLRWIFRRRLLSITASSRRDADFRRQIKAHCTVQILASSTVVWCVQEEKRSEKAEIVLGRLELGGRAPSSSLPSWQLPTSILLQLKWAIGAKHPRRPRAEAPSSTTLQVRCRHCCSPQYPGYLTFVPAFTFTSLAHCRFRHRAFCRHRRIPFTNITYRQTQRPKRA